jgi:hypothetical protein
LNWHDSLAPARLVIARHPLQCSPRDDYFMWLCEIVQIGRNIHVHAKNIAAIGRFDVKNATVM